MTVFALCPTCGNIRGIGPIDVKDIPDEIKKANEEGGEIPFYIYEDGNNLKPSDLKGINEWASGAKRVSFGDLSLDEYKEVAAGVCCIGCGFSVHLFRKKREERQERIT